ncbi:MAG TPA: hypothetical protein VF173_12590 [Thermoanaerobaculia bacterium]|nr:hypothetical protein [Thermoanaerobaculia bacterium]
MGKENRGYSWLAAPLGLLVLVAMTACSANGLAADGGEWGYVPLVARVTNISDSACRGSLSAQLASTLVKQGETLDDACAMSEDALDALSHSPDPRPFYAFSPSYMRYGFFVQEKNSGCVLHLFERQGKLFGKVKATFTNTSTYFSTSLLVDCSCEITFPLADEG